MIEHELKKPNFLKGAAILAAASIIVKIIGAFYRIPLFNILDAPGRGAFQVTYSVFGLILAISTSGIPAALSRLVSSAKAKGNIALVKRYKSVALPAFLIIGIVSMLVMFFFADALSSLLGNSLATPGIIVLAPAAFFACIIAVYRGYAQGHENMIPTAMSQIVEVTSKLVIGIAVALWFTNMNYRTNIVSAGAITGVTIGLGLCVPLLIWYNRRIDRLLPSAPDNNEVPDKLRVFARIMKVSIPISLSASFMAAMGLIDSAIVLNRLQSALGYSEVEASSLWGIHALGLSLFTLPPALVVPVSVSIIPAIAAALAKKHDNEAGVIMQSSFKLVNLIAMPAGVGLMILASPILIALYHSQLQVDYTLQLATTILVTLGAASFFVCLQFITTAILQANGYERVALLTFPVGAAIRFIIAYILSGIPAFGILGSSISTLICFVIISILNIVFIKTRIKQMPKFSKVFFKPLLCSAGMALASLLTYIGVSLLGYGFLGTGRLATVLYLAAAILVGIFIYIVLIIAVRVINKEDLTYFPKGDKLAKILRVR